MARADAKGVARYLPSVVQSAVGVVALSAMVSGAAIQRRRRRAAGSSQPGSEHPATWATSGSTGGRRQDHER